MTSIEIPTDRIVVQDLFAKVQMMQQKKGKGRLKWFTANSTNMWLDGESTIIAVAPEINERNPYLWRSSIII